MLAYVLDILSALHWLSIPGRRPNAIPPLHWASLLSKSAEMQPSQAAMSCLYIDYDVSARLSCGAACSLCIYHVLCISSVGYLGMLLVLQHHELRALHIQQLGFVRPPRSSDQAGPLRIVRHATSTCYDVPPLQDWCRMSRSGCLPGAPQTLYATTLARVADGLNTAQAHETGSSWG